MEFERFVKKPVEVSAIRWTPYNLVDVKRFLGKVAHEIRLEHEEGPHITIHTLEGNMDAKWGDWIIRGIRGELYPCKNDIFEETYMRKDDYEKMKTTETPVILYRCDKKACEKCDNLNCHFTTDITHAANFEKRYYEEDCFCYAEKEAQDENAQYKAIKKLVNDFMDSGKVSVNVIIDREQVSFNVYPCPYPINDEKEK